MAPCYCQHLHRLQRLAGAFMQDGECCGCSGLDLSICMQAGCRRSKHSGTSKPVPKTKGASLWHHMVPHLLMHQCYNSEPQSLPHEIWGDESSDGMLVTFAADRAAFGASHRAFHSCFTMNQHSSARTCATSESMAKLDCLCEFAQPHPNLTRHATCLQLIYTNRRTG